MARTKNEAPAADLTPQQAKQAKRQGFRLRILAAKQAESRVRCTIGELLIGVRETFYPTSATKRPTSKQVDLFKRWCQVNVNIGSSTVDQYIAAYAVITRQPAILEKVTTTRGLQDLGRLNDEELTKAAELLPAEATIEQVRKVMAKVSAAEKTKQDTAAKNGAASAATKQKEAAKRDEAAATKKLEALLPACMVEVSALLPDVDPDALCDAIILVATLIGKSGQVSYLVLPDQLLPYRGEAADEAAANEAAEEAAAK